ncbi:MAG TPA: MarR family transcriptional regulator [Actinomycetota bacterium]|nr:MarR family transcriptional regulator [Actinomycetota bacterium]
MKAPVLAPLLQEAYRSADRAISDRLRSRGFDVTRAHSAVLANIDIATGTRPTVLAERAAVTKQAIGQVIDDLEARSLVTRVADPTDRRARLIRLTAKGRRLVAAAQEVIQEIEASVLEEVSAGSMDATRRTLSALIQVTSR